MTRNLVVLIGGHLLSTMTKKSGRYNCQYGAKKQTKKQSYPIPYILRFEKMVSQFNSLAPKDSIASPTYGSKGILIIIDTHTCIFNYKYICHTIIKPRVVSLVITHFVQQRLMKPTNGPSRVWRSTHGCLRHECPSWFTRVTCSGTQYGLQGLQIVGPSMDTTVDGRNPAPVEVGSWNPIIYRVLYIPGGAGFLPSTVGCQWKLVTSWVVPKIVGKPQNGWWK